MIPSCVWWSSKASNHLFKAPSWISACSSDGCSKCHIYDHIDRNIPEHRTLQGSCQANAPFGRSFSDKLTHAHIFNININDIKVAMLTYAYDTNMYVQSGNLNIAIAKLHTTAVFFKTSVPVMEYKSWYRKTHNYNYRDD